VECSAGVPSQQGLLFCAEAQCQPQPDLQQSKNTSKFTGPVFAFLGSFNGIHFAATKLSVA